MASATETGTKLTKTWMMHRHAPKTGIRTSDSKVRARMPIPSNSADQSWVCLLVTGYTYDQLYTVLQWLVIILNSL